jgi:hypothetical protein
MFVFYTILDYELASVSRFGVVAALGSIDSGRIWAIVLGVLLAVVAIALLVASWTKWGQTKSLTKCIAIAFLAHVWLLMYAYGTRGLVPGIGGGNQGGARQESAAMIMTIMEMQSELESENAESESSSEVAESAEDIQPKIKPWESPLGRVVESDEIPTPIDRSDHPKLPAPPTKPVEPQSIVSSTAPTLEPDIPEIESIDRISEMAKAMETPNLVTAAPSPTSPPLLSSMERLASDARAMATPVPKQLRKLDQQPIPASYQMRLSPQRQQFAMLNGGDVYTEAAVERALAWLARSQGGDGGWNAAEYGAGREPIASRPRPDSEDRHKAGLKANTAMTGLALLAFLGAGHSHIEGEYKDSVARGLGYLLSQQLPSGDLSGREQIGREPTVRFARMYSHGMAGLALAEAFGMTGDPALRPGIQAACQYTLNAMNPRTGGWRYEFPTEDPGDTSQFGWQAMVLNSSANNQAIAISPQTRMLLQRFLDSVSTGRYGGLGVYRPRANQIAFPEQATPSMTAEALASKLLLGFMVSSQTAAEGQAMLLKNQPGQSEENLYYWYYATIAMYQMRGDGNTAETQSPAWIQWNESLKRQLCSTQVSTGKLEGSWNPTCVWGNYGGRVYSTAVACMCLEVYYRYLPMYKSDQFANQWQPARR